MARRIRSRVSVDGDAMPGFVVAEGFGAGAGDGAEAEAPRDGALRFFLSLMIVAIVVDANDTINDSEFTSLMPCWIVRVMIERIVLLDGYDALAAKSSAGTFRIHDVISKFICSASFNLPSTPST